MKFRIEEMVQREFHFAIVDEVDNIFIDEARMPLIISGPAEDAAELYAAIDKVIPELSSDDYEKDEKQRTVVLTETGTENVEQILGEMDMLNGETLYDITNVSLVHHVQQALRAHTLFQRDTDYIVKDDAIVIIDKFTGRMMEGRCFPKDFIRLWKPRKASPFRTRTRPLRQSRFRIISVSIPSWSA